MEIALEIARDLRNGRSVAQSSGAGAIEDSAKQAWLSRGASGIATFFGYLALVQPGRGWDSSASAHLDLAIDTVQHVPMWPSLYGGFPGVAWAAEHLRRRALSIEDPCQAVDAALIPYLARSPWPHRYDLISGLVGLGVYALERLPGTKATVCLELIVDRLAELALERPGGLTWVSPPVPVGPLHGRSSRGPHYDLGVAHGVPGVIAVLGKTLERGIARAKAERLLEGAVSWLLRQSLSDGSTSRFPHWVADGSSSGPARSAWCYGDPGVAASLLWAARCVEEPRWEREALAIALASARRPVEDAGVVDASFCHGAAGLGHVYNRLYQATGEELLEEAARYWFDKTLKMRVPGEGIAGFRFLELNGRDSEWVASPGLLTGAAGLGLALMAAVSPVEPAWDLPFLVSVPPRTS